MAVRNGKLAGLPNDIQQRLNHRISGSETARELAAWRNTLPEVQSILGSQFDGSQISEVNLTLWRQGGYLQWVTERECFDTSRALADGDHHLANTGLSAERFLNVLTVHFGELLMRGDLTPNKSASREAAFAEAARKALILKGISRSLLAIHRIKSHISALLAYCVMRSSAAKSNSPLPSPQGVDTEGVVEHWAGGAHDASPAAPHSSTPRQVIPSNLVPGLSATAFRPTRTPKGRAGLAGPQNRAFSAMSAPRPPKTKTLVGKFEWGGSRESAEHRGLRNTPQISNCHSSGSTGLCSYAHFSFHCRSKESQNDHSRDCASFVAYEESIFRAAACAAHRHENISTSTR